MSRNPISQEEQVAYTLAVIRLMHCAKLTPEAACKHLVEIINGEIIINTNTLFKGLDKYLPVNSNDKPKTTTIDKVKNRCTSKIGKFVISRILKRCTVLLGSSETILSGSFPGDSNYEPPKITTKQYFFEIKKQREIEQKAIEETEKDFGPSTVPYLRNDDGTIKNLVISDESFEQLRINASRKSEPQAPVERHYRIIKPLLSCPISYFINLYELDAYRLKN